MRWPYKPSRLVLILIGLCTVSCVDPERSNPFDSSVELLFLPKILEPSGGEQWFPGTQQTIRWLPATQVLDSLVTLQLICESDTTTLAQGVPNIGSFSWFVPHLSSSSCRIRIVGRVGAGKSSSFFRIKPLPVLKKLNIGAHEGRSPSALREKVLFVSRLHGNDNIWLLDRDDGSISRVTFNGLADTEPAWFKPLGSIFAYTAVDSNLVKNIWITATEGIGAGSKRQITFLGGEAAAWQNTAEQSQLAIAYVRADLENPLLKQVLAGRLNTPINALPLLGSPQFETLPIAVSDQSPSNENLIRTITWSFIDGNNLFLYHLGTGENNYRLWKVEFPGQNFASAVNNSFPIPAGLKPSQPKISPSGKWVAFSVEGDIWVSSISGISVTPLTFGENLEDSPDWASETEIVFSRRELETSGHNKYRPRELWTIQVSDPP